MSVVKSNGIIVNSGKRFVIKDGKYYEIPKHIKGNNVTTINDKIYINGYELKKNGSWKRTIIALWHMIF